VASDGILPPSGHGESALRGGGGGDDALVAGYPAFAGNDAALAAVLEGWTRIHEDATRVACLGAGAGLTGGYRLGDDGTSQTVFEDSAADARTGTQGRDLFFANWVADDGGPPDLASDASADDLWSDTDL
jgi:hypothetical protein